MRLTTVQVLIIEREPRLPQRRVTRHHLAQLRVDRLVRQRTVGSSHRHPPPQHIEAFWREAAALTAAQLPEEAADAGAVDAVDVARVELSVLILVPAGAFRPGKTRKARKESKGSV